MSNLPQFSHPKRETVEMFIARALTNDRLSPKSALHTLIAFDDGHFRALFNPSYFALTEGETAPTKSQWSTLKKHLKRLDPRLFIFKEHGATQQDGEALLYLDFGFFAHER
ncbi:MAG: hypothetical protein SGI73_17250 [Chloroflexota bacterium]|nr:hypothetical protein [Chloroflexota bacterium]